jgi:hypothetical protein
MATNKGTKAKGVPSGIKFLKNLLPCLNKDIIVTANKKVKL